MNKISLTLLMMLYINPVLSGIDEGREAFSEGNFDKAASEFRVSAEKGNPEAQFLLGLMYTLDTWKKNDVEAATWIKKAAEQGVPEAQYQLVSLYSYGKGVQQDMPKAFNWLNAAATQGHIKSQLQLGHWYAAGIAPQSYDNAELWFRKAAEQGDSESQYELGVILAAFKKYGEAAEWFLLSAKQGHTDAALQYALLLEDGKGVIQDTKLANEVFNQVTSNEKVKGEAFFQLGTKYVIDGFGVPQDYVVSTKWYRKAAELGHSSSQFILGKSYLEGHGVRQNKSEAKKWFGLNCDNGDQRGCDEYRTLNEQGIK
ncbi:MAG: tetratricopeptide repeat protein [Candidatus Thiodiazotropha taylori]